MTNSLHSGFILLLWNVTSTIVNICFISYLKDKNYIYSHILWALSKNEDYFTAAPLSSRKAEDIIKGCSSSETDQTWRVGEWAGEKTLILSFLAHEMIIVFFFLWKNECLLALREWQNHLGKGSYYHWLLTRIIICIIPL